MNKKYPIVFILSLLCLTKPLFAQQEDGAKWTHEVRVGLNLGGTAPLPIPAEIRKINSFTAGVNPIIGFRSTRWLDKHPQWGITSGVTIDYRGMKTSADVKYWYTDLVVGEGDRTGRFSGTFSGKNMTKVKNGYFTIPVLASYRPFKAWTFHAGGYFSWIHTSKFEGSASDGYIREGGPTGDRITVEESTYDFSDELKDIDAGITVGANWKLTKRIAATGELNWGLVPIFPADFKGVSHKMYNIYFSLGLSYRL
jgi:hypothetical protein